MTNLQSIRLSRGLTREALSERSKISLGNIIGYETRTYSINDAPLCNVYSLALALGCKIADLVDNE